MLNRSIWPHGMISSSLTMIPECEGGCPGAWVTTERLLKATAPGPLPVAVLVN